MTTDTIKDVISCCTSTSLKVINIQELIDILQELEIKGYIKIVSINGNDPIKYSNKMPFVDVFDVGLNKDSVIVVKNINLLEGCLNPIEEIYIFKDKNNFKLIVVGKTKNKLIYPNVGESGSSIWVDGIYALAKINSLELSSKLIFNDDKKIKTLLAINNQSNLALYSNGFFNLTLIIRKDGNKIIKNIPIKLLNDKQNFDKKIKELNL